VGEPSVTVCIIRFLSVYYVNMDPEASRNARESLELAFQMSNILETGSSEGNHKLILLHLRFLLFPDQEEDRPVGMAVCSVHWIESIHHSRSSPCTYFVVCLLL
ncbi:hypothetical protein MKW98_019271, partial [Papaver atlanticum]